MDNFLAIIPARGGSKRLKNKNILTLYDKPLIAWSIQSAKKSKYLDNIIVSSEDKNILKIAQKFKINYIKRNKKFAKDNSPTYLSIIEVIKKLNRIGRKYRYIVLLQPTSPLRTTNDIDSAIQLFLKRKIKAVVSISKTLHSPLWSFKAKDNLNLANIFNKDYFRQRSQDLPIFYQLNGSIYIIDVKYFLKYKTFLLKRSILGYKMNNINSIDIDDIIDFKLCETIIKEKLWNNN